MRTLPTMALALVALSTLATALVLEGAIRILHSRLWDRTHLLRERHLRRNSYQSQFDGGTGWRPRAVARWSDAVGRTYSHDADGLRIHWEHGPLRGQPIWAVATGDSYTWGDEVSNDETWPSHLERVVGRPVANGGVYGYGVDQILIRSRELVQRLRPQWTVAVIFEDDLLRAGLKVRTGVSKSWFEAHETGFRLRLAEPAPAAEMEGEGGASIWHRVLGYSHLANAVLVRVAPHFWLGKLVDDRPTGVDLEALHCFLGREFSKLAGQSSVLIVYFSTSTPAEPSSFQKLQSCLSRDIGILDLSIELVGLRSEDPQRYGRFFMPNRHFSAEGNRWMAERIGEWLKARP